MAGTVPGARGSKGSTWFILPALWMSSCREEVMLVEKKNNLDCGGGNGEARRDW